MLQTTNQSLMTSHAETSAKPSPQSRFAELPPPQRKGNAFNLVSNLLNSKTVNCCQAKSTGTKSKMDWDTISTNMGSINTAWGENLSQHAKNTRKWKRVFRAGVIIPFCCKSL